MIGAGTNNARLAAILRQLAQYHAKDQNNLFMVRIAQGLVHLGKGTLTLNPFHSDRQLMSPVAMAGLMSVLVSMLDVKTTILGKSHYLLYGLATAMQPRMLVTFDEELRPLPVSVRVGQVQSAKILLLPSKCKIIFSTLHKWSFFQYCDSNIGLFFIAPCKVFTLTLLYIFFGISSLLLF